MVSEFDKMTPKEYIEKFYGECLNIIEYAKNRLIFQTNDGAWHVLPGIMEQDKKGKWITDDYPNIIKTSIPAITWKENKKPELHLVEDTHPTMWVDGS